MSRSRRIKRSQLSYEPDVYWQSAAYNASLFTIYRAQIQKLILNRFKWVNLPATCDERFLEETLLYQGVATIAFPSRKPGTFFSTKVANTGKSNVYDTPSYWFSTGNNGWSFKVTPKNGVLVYDTRTRYPLMSMVDMWARELCDIRRTKQINRMHQKVPFIIKCSDDQEQQALNLYKQIAGGEPAVIVTTGVESIDIDVKPTGVPFMGEPLTVEELNTWNEIYTMLGIENLSYKSERMVQDEVDKNDEPTDIIALDALNCRREACEKLNDRFGEYLDAPISVVWAQDNESKNFNAVNDISVLSELGSGNGSSNGDSINEGDGDDDTE